jgi:hypothetical protein
MPEYENPPLIEAWIAFDFEPNPEKVSWDKSKIESFVKVQADEFTRIEMMVRDEVRIGRRS